MSDLVVCVDVGGTFVDLALFDGARLLRTHKVLNEPTRPEDAVLRGIGELVESAGARIAGLDGVVYSTTLAINAISRSSRRSRVSACLALMIQSVQVRWYQGACPVKNAQALALALKRRTKKGGSTLGGLSNE